MGIMSSIGNIVSGAVGAGNVSAGRALGRFRGLLQIALLKKQRRWSR